MNHIELRRRQNGVYYELNEHIDMNPLKSCQASSDTSLEYQQGVVWLHMALTGSKMAQTGKIWQKMVNFQKYSHVCGVGTLNLCQKIPDKILKESYQIVHSVQSKHPKCQKTTKKTTLTTFLTFSQFNIIELS